MDKTTKGTGKMKKPEINEIWYNSQNDSYFLITKVEESKLWILYPNGYSTRIQANEDIPNVYGGKFYNRCSFVRKSKLKFEDIFTH
jgi:hypothetical protein